MANLRLQIIFIFVVMTILTLGSCYYDEVIPVSEEEITSEISFSTEFIFADKEIKLTAKSREDLLDRIEKVKENLKKQKYDKGTVNFFKLFYYSYC